MADLGKLAADNVIKEYLYKILVIGEFGVGKSSAIKRYTEGTFDPHYKLTIGVDFALRTLEWDPDSKITLQLWDIAGHERFGHMTRVYYKYAIAAILVFDLTRPATFEAAPKWLEDVNSKVMLVNEDPIPVLLLANKCDLENAEVDTEMLNRFCQQHNLLGWFPTSVKENINIDEAIDFLVERIMEISSNAENALNATPLHDRNCVSITNEGHFDDGNKKSCCLTQI